MREVLTYYPTTLHFVTDGGREEDQTAKKVPIWGGMEVHCKRDVGTWRINRPGLTFRQRVELAGQRWSEAQEARGVDSTIVWKDGRVERIKVAYCSETMSRTGPGDRPC